MKWNVSSGLRNYDRFSLLILPHLSLGGRDKETQLCGCTVGDKLLSLLSIINLPTTKTCLIAEIMHLH